MASSPAGAPPAAPPPAPAGTRPLPAGYAEAGYSTNIPSGYAVTKNPDGTVSYADGFGGVSTAPAGFTPIYQSNGQLYQYLDPNGAAVGVWGVKSAVQNPDGSITYPDGNGGKYTTTPGGAAQDVGSAGITTNYDANGQPTSNVITGTNTPATPDQIKSANNQSNGPLGNGGVLGMGTNPFSGAAAAIGALTGQLGMGGPIDTSALTKAISDSQALRDQYNVPAAQGTAPVATAAQIQAALAAGSGPVSAATMSPAQIAAYQAAKTQAPIVAGQSTAGQSTASQIGSTALAQQQAAIQAQQVKAALAARTVLGPTATADQTRIDPVTQATLTKLGPTAIANAAKIDTTNADQVRAQQQALAGSIQGTIAGTNPSVAAILLKQQTEANIANQYALAAGATGNNVGLAQFQAMNNAANLNQTAIGQQALLRAQEIATAQGQLGGVLGQVGGQDINLATAQAGLGQQTNLANQGALNTSASQQLSADVQTKLANAGFVNTQNMTQAQLNQAVNLANAGFKNTATTTQAQLDQATSALNAQQQNQVGLGNASNALDASKTNASLAQAVQLANAGALNDTSKTNASLANATGIANAGNVTQSNVANAANTTSANSQSSALANAIAIANAGNLASQNQAQASLNQGAAANNQSSANSTNQFNAGQQQQNSQFNAGQQNSTATTNANLATDISKANATNNLNQQTINNAATQNAAANTLTAQGQAISGSGALTTAQAAGKAANDALITGAVTGLLSDRREKKDIAPADGDIDKLLASLKEYRFKYKDPKSPGATDGQRFGVMAQDLEKSAAGKSLVRDTPDGKMVDVNQAVLAALAGLGNVNRRLSAMEKR